MGERHYGIVYLIENSCDGKRYVGQTTYSLKRRFTQHCGDDRKMLVSRAIRKHGKVNFTARAIFVAFDKDQLDAAELQLISDYDARFPSGYNLKAGGARGKHHQDTCAKIGAAHRGKKISQEQKAKHAAAMKGFKHSAETKEKIAAAKRFWGPEVFEKIAAANRGRRHSVEARQKMSLAMRGKPKSPEHRAKLSASLRARYQANGDRPCLQ